MDDKIAWDMYFASVTAMQFHPRNEIRDIPTEVIRCGLIADLMLVERSKRHGSNMGSSDRSRSKLPRRDGKQRSKQRPRARK